MFDLEEPVRIRYPLLALLLDDLYHLRLSLFRAGSLKVLKQELAVKVKPVGVVSPAKDAAQEFPELHWESRLLGGFWSRIAEQRFRHWTGPVIFNARSKACLMLFSNS